MAYETQNLVFHNEELHQVMDIVKETRADLEQGLKEIGERNTEMDQNLGEIKRRVLQLSEITAQQEKRMAELDKRLSWGNKVYHLPGEEDRNDTASMERRMQLLMFLTDLVEWRRSGQPKYNCELWQKREQLMRTQTAGVQAQGGYALPELVDSEIRSILASFGLARQLCLPYEMDADTVHLTTTNDLPQVKWMSQVTGTEMPSGSVSGGTRDFNYPKQLETGITLARTTLQADSAVALDAVSLVLNRANPSLANVALQRIALAYAREEDFQCFVSPGPPGQPFLGILNDTGIVTHTGVATTATGTIVGTTGASPGYDFLLDLLNASDPFTQPRGVYVMSADIVNLIRRMKDSTGHPLWSQVAESAPDRLNGQRYFKSAVMPTRTVGSNSPFIIYGDFMWRVFGDRMQFTVDVSSEYLFGNFALAFRFEERIAFATLLKTPFAIGKTASS